MHRRSPDAQAYHRWYGLKVWCHKPTGLRWRCLSAALFTCNFCGWQAGHNTHLLHCDHIVPHRGNWELFIDPTNLQALCETCSNAVKQSEERIGYSKRMGNDGWPADPMHPANRRP